MSIEVQTWIYQDSAGWRLSQKHQRKAEKPVPNAKIRGHQYSIIIGEKIENLEIKIIKYLRKSEMLLQKRLGQVLNINKCPKLEFYLKLDIRVDHHLFLSKFEKKVMKLCSVGTSKAHLGFFFLIKLLFFGGRFPFVSLKSRYEYKKTTHSMLLDSN